MGTAPALHVDVDGSGPTVVLGHGFGGSARNYLGLARALAPRWRVLRFDARGHARSDAPDDPAAYGPDAFVGDVARVLDRVGAAHAVVGGLSMGADIALRFALAHPERVDGLVLAAFPAGPATPGGFANVAHAFADAIERDGLEAAGARFAWAPSSGLDPQAAALVRRGFLEHAPHGLAHTLRGVIAAQPSVEELAPRLRTVAQPALVIVGARDRGLAASRALAGVLPRARLVVVDGAGHVVNLARPAEFNGAVADFLAATVP
jgi:pimeloyl-ACP methyl ester carboxylesterase